MPTTLYSRLLHSTQHKEGFVYAVSVRYDVMRGDYHCGIIKKAGCRDHSYNRNQNLFKSSYKTIMCIRNGLWEALQEARVTILIVLLLHDCTHACIYSSSPQGNCSIDCRITYCHTCYYDDELRPLPGDCEMCSYYPGVHQANNRCFKRWATCTRRANAAHYTKV